MKCAACMVLLSALTALGCASPEKLVLSPVGPAPNIAAESPTSGSLIVYSAWQRTGTDDPEHPRHSSYEVFAADGKRLLHVRNYTTPMLDDPATVPLAPGNYMVKARVQGYGLISIPVVVESRKVTALYLDDTSTPRIAANGPARVCLPDGRFVGWAGFSPQ